MSLIRLEDGDLINTQNVVKLTKLRGKNYKFLDTNGEVHIGETHEPEEKFWPILPAAAGYVAIYPEDDGSIRLRTVIGWRVCPGGNFALVEGSELNDYEYQAIRQPDGSVIDFDGNIFGSIDAFLGGQETKIADAA